jgi:CheY-like chemotaxis protein
MTRILIIDDSSFQRRILSSLLEGMDYTILVATNGNEGLDAALRERPDLIITDLLMPDLDGLAFLKKAKEAGLSMPIIILTSDIQTATRNRCVTLGAAGVMHKPVKKEELTQMVRQALDTGMS